MTGPIYLPDDFCERSAPEFAVSFGLTSARFWHCHRLGNVQNETVDGLHIRGSYAAMRWMAGRQPIPPGSSVPRSRTRYDLLDLLRLVELCTDSRDRWELESASLPTGLFFPEVAEARGVQMVYEWAVRIRNHRPAEPLTPEDHDAALAHYRALEDEAARRYAA